MNRLLSLTYPDGEVMTYEYDAGGSVNRVASVTPVPNNTSCTIRQAQPTSTEYVRHIGYDEFGQRTRMDYGNRVSTSYVYEPVMRRLSDVNTDRPSSTQANATMVPLQRLHYSYDKVGNVLTMANNLPVPSQENRTGPTQFTFAYDDLYQLTAATGRYQSKSSIVQTHSLGMAYDEIGNITRKDQVDIRQVGSIASTQSDTSHAWDFTYGSTSPHRLTKIGWRDPQPAPISNLFRGARRDFSYDANGNQTKFEFIERNESRSEATRTLNWNEENRLKSVTQDGIHIEDAAQSYLYDSEGTRTHRRLGSGSCPDETKYANEYFVSENDDVATKHVYAAGQRIATSLLTEEVQECEEAAPVYFFHPDHLQSTEYLTNRQGAVTEHDEYFASGEPWIDERNDIEHNHRLDYLFNGKELDPETKLYYYGARYYDAQQSQWLSPDPSWLATSAGT